MSQNQNTKPVETKIQDRISTLISNIAADFSLDKLSKSPARFNTEKLNWFNREYIKMLSLEEFCLRSFKLELDRKFPDSNLRKGVYIYLVDFAKNLILTCDVPTTQGQDGINYMLGGGMDEGETEIQTLLREIDEESLGVIKLKEIDCKYITTCKILGTRRFFRDGVQYEGKEMSFWFCEFDSTKFEILESLDSQTKYYYNWIKLETLIETNTHLTYPIWKEFCNINNIPCFAPTYRIKTQYLAWSMDKSRVTTLNEFGLESDCILNHHTPEKELIKWKKITLEESIENLKEILPVLQSIYTKLEPERNQLMASEINDLPVGLEAHTKLWEDELKSWIGTNNKDAGSYFWPLRTALSGKAKSPSPFEILAILSWEEIKLRINGVVCL
jgi:Anticodon binding domain/NUDIX domain